MLELQVVTETPAGGGGAWLLRLAVVLEGNQIRDVTPHPSREAALRAVRSG
jgi:hypothetical protein